MGVGVLDPQRVLLQPDGALLALDALLDVEGRNLCCVDLLCVDLLRVNLLCVDLLSIDVLHVDLLSVDLLNSWIATSLRCQGFGSATVLFCLKCRIGVLVLHWSKANVVNNRLTLAYCLHNSPYLKINV